MSGKEMKFKLKTKNTTTTEGEDEQEKFTYVPVADDLAKKVKIAISQVAGSDIVEDMGLPTEIGDTVFIEIGAKNKQTKLTEENRIEEPSIHEPIEASEFQDPEPQQKKKRRGRHGKTRE